MKNPLSIFRIQSCNVLEFRIYLITHPIICIYTIRIDFDLISAEQTKKTSLLLVVKTLF